MSDLQSDFAGDVGLAARRVRVLIVYMYPFLRDLLIKVLSTGPIEIVAAVQSQDLDGALIERLRPEVLVVDQATLEQDGTLKGAALLCHAPEVACRLVVVDESNPVMLVWQKQLVSDADTSRLIWAVVTGSAGNGDATGSRAA